MIPRSRLSVLTAPGAGDLYAAKVLATSAANLLAYWPFSEGSGVVAGDLSGNSRDGQYDNGCLLGQPGIGDGRTCPWFDGVNDRVTLYSASLGSAWSFAEFSMALWMRMNSAAVWTDSTNRSGISFTAPSSEYFYISRAPQNNGLTWYLRLGGVDAATNTYIGGDVGGDWFHLGFTSKSGGNAYRYVNGAESTHKTGVASPLGGTLSSAYASGQANTWYGWIAHVAVWDVQLSAAQMAALASVS